MSQKVEIEVRLDNKHFAEGANAVKMEISALSRHADSEGEKMGGIFDGLGKKVAGAFAVSKLVEFEKKIIDVRGETESLRISFETLAGEHIGRQLYEDIKQFATTTPMMMNDLAKGAQTLLGFNIEAEKVMPILRQIGDISMGDAQKFNSLTLAFAQTSSTGKLMGQDLLQMINAGFNPLVVISEKTGKSVAKLKEEMSQGAITVEMVEDAFRTATAEGGKFHGMLEKQSKGIKGAVSNLQGAWQDMLNDIGEKQQDFTVDGAKLATTLVQNYEKVGQVLLGLVTTYGTYKAAVIAVTLAETTANGQRMITVKWLRLQAAAQALLNKTMLANPYVLAATALAVLVGAIIAARDGLTDAERAQRDYNKTLEEAKRKQEEYNNETQEAINKAKDDSAATSDRESAMQTLIARYPEIIKKYIDEKGHLRDILNLKREIATYDGQMANLDNKTRADMYNKYIQVLKKARRGEQLNETERILYQGAEKKYNETTPWYSRLSGNYTSGAIDYFQNMSRQAERAYKRYNTEQKVNELADKMGKMGTDELKKLSAALTKEANIVQKGQAKFLNEVGDWLEKSDFVRLSTTAEGILNARSGKKKELTDKEKKAAEKSAEDEARRRQKLFEADMRQTEDLARQKRELEDALAQLEIAQEANASKREAMQIEKDHKDRLDAIDRQTEEWKKAAYKAAEERFNATNTDKKKKFSDTPEGKAGWQAQSLTEEQSKTEKALIETANADYKRTMQERYESQVQAMRDYLKEFGTFQEQKYAIEKEYDDKISKERDEWRKKQLEDEKKKALDSIDVELLRTEIDWSTMFDGIGGALEDEMKATLEKIEKYMQTDAFKNLDAKEKSEFVKMRNDLYQKTGSGVGAFDFSIYGQIADDLKTYQQAVLNHKQALIIHTEAINKAKEIDAEVEEAKKRLEKAVTEEEKRIAQENLDAAQQRQKLQQGVVIGTRNQVQNAQAQVVDSQGNVKRSLSEAEKALGSFSDALNQMSSGTLKGFADGIVNLIAAIGGKDGSSLAGLGKVGGIIGAIFSIIDALGDAPAKFFDDLFDKISTVIAAVIEQIPQIVVSVIKGAGSIIGSVATGFGNLFTNLFGGGPDNSEYKKALEKWGNILDVWRDTIDYQRELMEKAYGADVVALQSKSVEQLNKVMEAAKDQYLGWMNSGAGTFSHSHGHDINETANWRYLAQTDPEMLKWLGGSVWQDSEGKWHDEEVGDLRKLAEMDWKDLERFKNENAQFWATIHEDVRGYLETYIEAGKELEETMNIANEKLTTTTKENVIDSLTDSLNEYANTMSDVTESAEDDWHKMVNEMVIDNIILKDVLDDLEKWYEDLAEVQKKRNNGEYASDEEYLRELENLNKRREQILQKGQDKVDEYREAGIIQTIDTEDAETSFKNLRDLYRETLLDMESDSEAFRKKLSQILAEDLLNSQVFDVKMTVNGKDFENFDAYAKDWNQRYADALKAGDEAALDALIDELVEQKAILQEAAENIRERLKETQEDTTFKDMADSWTSTLMDMTKTAEDWAQDIGRTMAEKIISQMVAPTMMQPLLDKLQEAFNTAMGADGATWKSVMADGGVLAALGAIKDAYPELQEVVKQIMEALGVTVNEEAKEGFSDLKGTIISAIMDSDGDIKKFAADLGKGMVEQMVKAMTDQKYGEQIKALNEEWASTLESGDPARIEAVKQKVLELYAAIGNDEEIKKLLDDIRELGESTPFDNLQDSFLSTLMNMEGSADDFVKDLKKKLAEALVSDIVIGKDFADKLEYYKEQYKRIMGDPSLSDEERAKAISDLADTWREYTEGKKQEADEINKWLGTYEHEDQQATMNMANAATYDQYELSLGMQTSQLMVAEQHKEISRQILETLQGMSGITKPGTNYGEQIFMRLGTTNESLLAIKKELIAMHTEFSAKIDLMNSHFNKL